ncbi:MAG: zinc-binding alcohol dehydrogenase family protein [Dehalococcoidia bacterium]|nr:zinc-binding alcohol dehydrogenase family protein [Dehalococcoidia bacterium]
MKAAVYYETGSADVFRYEDVPDPQCRPGGIVFDVRAVSIEGGDLLHRAGGEMAFHAPASSATGAAGIVREVGERVTRFSPGDAVVATMPHGSHASVCSVPEQAAYAVPGDMDLKQAAVVPIAFGTADDCLFEFGDLRAGETVLIQAAGGGVGLAAVQLARRAGATVIGTASSAEKLERLKDFGLHHGMNYREQNLADETRRLTDGRGADLIVDSVGGRTLEASIEALAYRGRISWVGNAGRDTDIPDVRPIMQKNASLNGVFLGAEFARSPGRTGDMVERLLRDVQKGIELQVVIGPRVPAERSRRGPPLHRRALRLRPRHPRARTLQGMGLRAAPCRLRGRPRALARRRRRRRTRRRSRAAAPGAAAGADSAVSRVQRDHGAAPGPGRVIGHPRFGRDAQHPSRPSSTPRAVPRRRSRRRSSSGTAPVPRVSRSPPRAWPRSVARSATRAPHRSSRGSSVGDMRPCRTSARAPSGGHRPRWPARAPSGVRTRSFGGSSAVHCGV